MKKLLLISVLALLTWFPAYAEEGASLETLRQAAVLGNTDAQLELGMLYEFGYNMAKNNVTALAWYTVAAEQGNAIAVKRRDLLASRLTPEELDEVTRQTAEIHANKSAPAPVSTSAPALAAPAVVTPAPSAVTPVP